jgi:hypothetical protein
VWIVRYCFDIVGSGSANARRCLMEVICLFVFERMGGKMTSAEVDRCEFFGEGSSGTKTSKVLRSKRSKSFSAGH